MRLSLRNLLRIKCQRSNPVKQLRGSFFRTSWTNCESEGLNLVEKTWKLSFGAIACARWRARTRKCKSLLASIKTIILITSCVGFTCVGGPLHRINARPPFTKGFGLRYFNSRRAKNCRFWNLISQHPKLNCKHVKVRFSETFNIFSTSVHII